MWSVIADPRRRALSLLTLLMIAVPACAKDDTTEWANAVMKAMGGKDTFDADRYLTFRFVVERDGKQLASNDHAWDRYTGRYRLDSQKDGKPVRVIMNVNDRQGRVWVEGKEVEGDATKPYLEMAYGRFINDSYWLLMPWKWLDPGVTLHDEGERNVDGADYHVVSLSFGNVGLTPKDRYWAFISKKDGLMRRWEFVLQNDDGSPGTGAPTPFTWEDWKDGGDGLLFCRKHVKIGSGPALAILFPDVKISKDVDESAFTPPTGNGE